MKNLKLYELIDEKWKEQPSFDFGLVIIGERPVSKTVCFSPVEYDIIGLESRIEPREHFDFVEDQDHLSEQWKKIEPQRINIGEYSHPIKIEFSVGGDKVRMDYFKIEVKYIEVPSEENT